MVESIWHTHKTSHPLDAAAGTARGELTMEHKELTAQLRRMSVETGSLVCLGCGYEHNCGIHGCALLRQAVETIEKQDAAIGRLRGHESSDLVEE